MADTINELTEFLADLKSTTTPGKKNTRLASKLNGSWNPYQVVKIERIEIGSKPGWRVTYRT